MAETEDPVKTAGEGTATAARRSIVLHVSASVGDDDAEWASLEADIPVDFEPYMSGNTLFVPKTDATALTKRLTNGIDAFIDAFSSHGRGVRIARTASDGGLSACAPDLSLR